MSLKIHLAGITDPSVRGAFVSMDRELRRLEQRLAAAQATAEGVGLTRTTGRLQPRELDAAPDRRATYARPGELAYHDGDVYVKRETRDTDVSWDRLARANANVAFPSASEVPVVLDVHSQNEEVTKFTLPRALTGKSPVEALLSMSIFVDNATPVNGTVTLDFRILRDGTLPPVLGAQWTGLFDTVNDNLDWHHLTLALHDTTPPAGGTPEYRVMCNTTSIGVGETVNLSNVKTRAWEMV